MLNRLRDTVRSERTLPQAIRLELVDGLFHPFASLIVGALAGLFLAATVTLLVRDPLVQAVADLTFLVALGRIFVGFRYVRGNPADAHNGGLWELAYAAGAALFSAGLGLLA